MLTRLLHEAGLYLGDDSDLMPARQDNPDGFWENLRFVSINDEILSVLGGAWDLPPPPEADLLDPQLDSLRLRARELLNDFEAIGKCWGWKDPRTSLTFSFWKDVLPNLKTIVVVRNPLEVAHSLQQRNGTSHAFGLRLWEIYHRRLHSATSPSGRLVTHYDFFFDNAEAELRRIARFVGLPAAEFETAASLVAAGRRHTVFTIDEMAASGVSREVIDLYRILVTEAETAEPSALAQDLTSPGTQEPDFLSGAANAVLSSRIEHEAVSRALTLLQTRDERDQARLERDQARLERETFRAEADAVRERFLQTNHLLQDASMRLVKAETRISLLTQQLRQQLQASKKLIHFLEVAGEAAERLKQSRRWKLANPSGWLGATLFHRPIPGFGHLDKVLQRFAQWRNNHPEAANLGEAIHALNFEATGGAGKSIPFVPPVASGPISFPVHEDVEVSIIVPVFNQLDYTQACLASIRQFLDEVKIEVIIVDDGSDEVVAKKLQDNQGVVVLRNESNSGFINSCNRGAEQARGSYLVFLNNDTVVTPGWLRALRETFALEPRAGLVGSKLVFPDGRLQEAGGIIWRDATGWNRGKFQDADKPEYNFLREMDYCSAASLMVPRKLFVSLGGFDPTYAPGYYEDTDLAFKAREAGYKVFYQPLSRVIHYEGATGGTDISAGAKRYQEINRATFAARWAEQLAQRPPNGDVAAHERLRPEQKRILVIDHHLPMPDRDSGSLRMSQILLILHRLGHRVTFVPDNLADIPPYGDNLRKRGIEVMHHPYLKNVRDYLSSHGTEFDVVILSRRDFAQKHIADVRQLAPQSRVIFDTVDLHFLRENRQAEHSKNPELTASIAERRDLELYLIGEADETWVVSPAEQELLRTACPGKSIQIVSNIVDVTGSTTPFSLRSDILFIGSFQHTPNIDAVCFFARDIFPRVRQQLGPVRFYIIGDKAPPEVIALATEDIIITGYQPDVTSYFERIRVSVAPLRFGAGVKGKINQSMSFGVPVVATSMAIEGMGLRDRQDVLVADDAATFGTALVELYQSEELWQRVSANSVRRMEETYSVDVARKQLQHLLAGESAPGRGVDPNTSAIAMETRRDTVDAQIHCYPA